MSINNMIGSLRRSLGRDKKDNRTNRTPTPLRAETEAEPQAPKQKKSHSSNNSTADVVPDGNQDTLLPGIGPYRFARMLGRGKFSRVMLARHRETGEQVAIKIIDKQVHDYRVMSRLVREIHLMEMLDHENIVKLYETYETCDTLFLVVEYVPGMNLDEYLHRKGGFLSEDEARIVFRQIVSAVQACHYHWVVHRDLKTPNVLITPEGVVKIADFGLGNRFGLQRLKTICGSMLYYSPEIITSQKYAGPEVDCWCLGISLFRMTAGFDPFSHAHTVGELKKDVCSCNFPMPDTLSPELRATIRKCIQTDHRKRSTVRHTLKDDPWLTKSGELPCLFSELPVTSYDKIVSEEEGAAERTDRESRTRRQFLKDLEHEKNRQSTVKHTIIYHPINPSTYFTTGVVPKSSSSSSSSSITHHCLNQHHYHYLHKTVQALRSELVEAINAGVKQLGIRPREQWSSPVQSLALRLMPSTNDIVNNKKPTYHFKLSEILQRLTKDQVYCFQLDNAHQPHQQRPPPSLSSSSSTSYSSLSTQRQQQQQNIDSCNDDNDPLQQDLTAIMSLLKLACQLVGISYTQESPTRLMCVFTLRDISSNPGTHDVRRRQQQQQQHQNQKVGGGGQARPPASNQHRGRRTSHASTQTTVTATTASGDDAKTSSTNPWQDGSGRSRRMSLPPLISLLTSSMMTSFFARTRLRQQQQAAEAVPIPETTTAQQQRSMANGEATSRQNMKRDGIAVFSVDLENRSTHTHHRIISLRFSKQRGSATVFKIAVGWVTNVTGVSRRKTTTTTTSGTSNIVQ